MTVGIAEQGSGRSESGVHNEPLVGRRGGGARSGTQELPADGAQVTAAGMRGCDAGQGGALLWEATITRLGAIGYSM